MTILSFLALSDCVESTCQCSYDWMLLWVHPSVLLSTLLLFTRSVVSKSLWPHGLQQASLPCPSPSPGVCSNSCPLCCWCHPTISFSAAHFSSCLRSFPASGPFPMGQLFASGGQSFRALASALVLPMNIQGWFPLELTVSISLQSKGLSSLPQHHRGVKQAIEVAVTYVRGPMLVPIWAEAYAEGAPSFLEGIWILSAPCKQGPVRLFMVPQKGEI